jgi:hypothetical protein
MMFSFSKKVVWWILIHQGSPYYALASSPAHNTTSNHVAFANNTGQRLQSSSPSLSPDFSTAMAGLGQSASSTTAYGMGDFIAMGMGMSDTSDLPSTDISKIATSSETSSSEISPSYRSSQTSDGSAGATTQQNTSSIEVSTTTSKDILHGTGTANSSTKPSGYIPIGTEPPVWGNQSHTLTFSGDCWNQWSQYWSAEALPAEEITYLSTRPGGTETSFNIEGDYLSTSTILSSYETTVFNGRFPITTYTTLAPKTVYDWISGTPTTTVYFTHTIISEFFEVVTRPTPSLQSPLCILPSSVSQCQQSWDSYIGSQKEKRDIRARDDGPPGCDPAATTEIPWSCQAAISSWNSARLSSFAADDPPKCSQAKIAEDYCSSTLSEFLWRGEAKGYFPFEYTPWTPTTIDGTATSAMVWPSNATVGGPGCTLGCGNCALQGETVELLFWPPATSSANKTATVDHVGPWTLETLGTTLTSPTV